ncbi:hypothetical protein [Rhizobium sp. PL01]|jgi:hypothetical protein|uniref:hypothetical protein n=1 Tax=Rhizobium sp. PL01 TaxID=3085631 RepID=UPI0029820D45|nr:hypothetical protein [Rhizobium sp. PL01]MDW5313915.1 hypothetical protein [Rhizobium sp. PL01]
MKLTAAHIFLVCVLTVYPLNVVPPAWTLGTPRVLERPQLIAWASLAGFIDGCDYAVYRLSLSMTEKVRTIGLKAFEGPNAKPISNSERNPYSKWAQTPVPLDEPVYALNSGGCNGPGYSFDLQKVAGGNTSYFSLSRNHEGIWLVDTVEGIVVFSYSG